MKPYSTSRRDFLRSGLHAAGLAMFAGFAGCSSRDTLQSLRDELHALREDRVALPPLPGFRDLRGVIHSHSYISGDSDGPPADIFQGARDANLDYLVMTDHYDPKIFTEGLMGQYGDLLVIRGAEFPLGCTRKRGLTRRCASLLGFGFERVFTPDSASKPDLVQSMKAHGGLVFLGHPRGVPDPELFGMVHGLEVFNIADTMREHYLSFPSFLVDLFVTRQEYHEELLVSVIERPNWLLARWDALAQMGHRLVGIGGNDAHQNLRVLGVQVDPYGLTYRILNTHVLVPEDANDDMSPSSEQAVLAALKQGHCFLAFSLLCDASGFQFYAADRWSGSMVAMMGEAGPSEPLPRLVIRLPRAGAIEVVRNGVPEFRTIGTELEYAPSAPGVYRVEVFLKVQERWRPWIISNPICL